MLIVVTAVVLSKALAPIVVTLFGIVRVVRLPLFLNELSPIDVTLEPITRVLNAELFLKTELSMAVSPLPMVIEAKAVLLSKALAPIVKTLSGITRVVKAVFP